MIPDQLLCWCVMAQESAKYAFPGGFIKRILQLFQVNSMTNLSLIPFPQRWFLVNALKLFFQAKLSTFRSLEVHSKRRYKICICSFLLGELEVFRNNKCRVIFAILENFRCNNTRFTKMRLSLFPLTVIFLNLNILGFLFYENQPNRQRQMV